MGEGRRAIQLEGRGGGAQCSGRLVKGFKQRAGVIWFSYPRRAFGLQWGVWIINYNRGERCQWQWRWIWKWKDSGRVSEGELVGRCCHCFSFIGKDTEGQRPREVGLSPRGHGEAGFSWSPVLGLEFLRMMVSTEGQIKKRAEFDTWCWTRDCPYTCLVRLHSWWQGAGTHLKQKKADVLVCVKSCMENSRPRLKWRMCGFRNWERWESFLHMCFSSLSAITFNSSWSFACRCWSGDHGCRQPVLQCVWPEPR